MEVLEVVIKIPRNRYETLVEINDRIKKGESIYKLGMYEKAIANGIPLPEGHGRLIDADEFAKKIMHDNTIEDVDDVFDAIVNSTTILDAEVSE